MSALAAFRTAILALLDDATSARFTSAQIDQALRVALSEYSRARPLQQTTMLDTAGTRFNSLPSDFGAFKITKVEILADNSDNNLDIPFYAYMVDQQWAFETTDRIVSAGYVFKITYAGAHTVANLDSADETTFPIAEEAILHVGAAGFAAQSRAVSRAETINMQKEVRKQLQEMADQYLAEFRAGIVPAAGSSVAQLPAIPSDL